MKILVLGDTHGRDAWKQVINQEFDSVIFIGDYFDSFDIDGADQVGNFMDTIAFKDSMPDKVILLIGNHDYHYLDVGERYSGFQKGYQYLIRDVLTPALPKMQMCKNIGDYWFSHAGISKVFLERIGLTEVNLEQELNDLWTYKPQSFKFYGRDIYGDDPGSSPIWIRPKSLTEYKTAGIHVVGHSQQPKINFIKGVWFTDCPGQYLMIQDGVASVIKL